MRTTNKPKPADQMFAETFIREALETSGNGNVQTLLGLSILATFLKRGEKLAHMMGINTPSTRPAERRRRNKIRYAQSGKRNTAGRVVKRTRLPAELRARRAKVVRRKSSPRLELPSVPIADPSQANGTSQWPRWPDPLDFHEAPEDEAIARLNAAGYFVLTRNGDIYKIGPSGGVSVQKPGGFASLFACRQALGNDGKLISAGTAWKRSRAHREYRIIGYWPGDRGRPAKSYNLWRGWGIEPKQGDWSIIRVISDGHKDKADYILDWSAHMVQRPWEKPGVALVLKGRKGTGKTLLTQMLARVIGRQNTLITANGKKLFAQFNWHLADKILIGAEEAFFGRSRELSDQLKHLLTGDEIELEQKFGQRISMKSMHRMIITSNHEQVIEASEDERRFFVCNVSDKRRRDDDYFAPLVRIVKGEDNVSLAAFMHELQMRDITNWKPEQAARNAVALDLVRQKSLNVERLCE